MGQLNLLPAFKAQSHAAGKKNRAWKLRCHSRSGAVMRSEEWKLRVRKEIGNGEHQPCSDMYCSADKLECHRGGSSRGRAKFGFWRGKWTLNKPNGGLISTQQSRRCVLLGTPHGTKTNNTVKGDCVFSTSSSYEHQLKYQRHRSTPAVRL